MSSLDARDVIGPLDAVRRLLLRAVAQRGIDLAPVGLRIFDSADFSADSDVPDEEAVHGAWVSPFDLGRTYELLLTPTARRRAGAHLTPEGIARNLVAALPEPRGSATILDPAVGGAAFLLAAADRLVATGASAPAVTAQLHGVDIDPGAVAVAEAAIVLWGADHGVAPAPLPNIVVGDGLLMDLPTVDQVVGNPPFLNQLRSSSTNSAERRALLRERWGDLVSSYTDDAWLFLAAGLDALKPGGSLAMVQPVSLLAARDAEFVRARVHDRTSLAALWIARDRVFDAAVQVCGVVLAGEPGGDRPVERSVGADFAPVAALAHQPTSDEWGSTGAATLDIPTVHLHPATGSVADIATATAGFRDQFYGFVPVVSDAEGDQAPTAEWPRLVTVGMIDVLGLSWGQREFRFAKQRFVRPVVDREALRSLDPTLAAWTDARCRPKLLMATQTRVVEVWVDTAGHAVPATPVVSIEPIDGEEQTLWLLAAALTAPAISARFLASKFGTAMALNSMKLSARDVAAVPLPINQRPWHEAATLLQTRPDILEDFASLMGEAYDVVDPALERWWLDRVKKGSNTG